MESKELRIGNYVCTGKLENGLDQISVIHEINSEEYRDFNEGNQPSFKHLGDNTLNNFLYNDDGLDQMFPIPLTEEWLLKFGFIDNNYTFDNDYLTISWGSRVVSTGVRSSFYLSGEIPENWKTRIQYVHQLQNLYFSLTNTELKLKND